jgi:hypothetical protein
MAQQTLPFWIKNKNENIISYVRGGQLFWLGGHFVEAEVGGGPLLLK